ncbi:MAG: hypothetical protein DBX51_03245 [Clostridiales bacterium]|nr:MAG: hypothetical protein DBX51_03245 [Clostridiales bacterium]
MRGKEKRPSGPLQSPAKPAQKKRSTQLLKRPFPAPRTANGCFRRKPRMCRGLQVHNRSTKTAQKKRSTQPLKRPFPVLRTANGCFRRKPRMCRGLQVHN